MRQTGLILALCLISGCSTIQPAISGFVDGYCMNTPQQRKAIRETTNAMIAPHKLEIKCFAVKGEQNE